jgi:hypothetical protein
LWSIAVTAKTIFNTILRSSNCSMFHQKQVSTWLVQNWRWCILSLHDSRLHSASESAANTGILCELHWNRSGIWEDFREFRIVAVSQLLFD